MTTQPLPDFAHQTALWRAASEQRLRAANGWLAVSGLFWLDEGETTFGTHPDCGIVLPSGPARAGVFTRVGNRAGVRAEAGSALSIKDVAVSGSRPLHDDASGTPDVLRLGQLSMVILRRGNRMGVRLWDAASPNRLNFGGRRWYAPDERYCVHARFVADPHPITIINILGDATDAVSPGWVEFDLLGKARHLSVESSDASKKLFINFKDATSGKTTYGASRFLYTDGVRDDRVVVDFNRAVSPPCAFTAFATCPLPRRENVLSIAVEAGELYPAADNVPG
jgi:hypothetical protein